jgi:hypothetical protein
MRELNLINTMERAESKCAIIGVIHLKISLLIWAINLGQDILWTAKIMMVIMSPRIADGLLVKCK